MGNRNKARAAVYVMAGGYLLYLAYKLFTSRAGAEESDSVVMLIFAIFFVVVGAATFGLAFYMSKKGVSRDKETNSDDNVQEQKELPGDEKLLKDREHQENADSAHSDMGGK